MTDILQGCRAWLAYLQPSHTPLCETQGTGSTQIAPVWLRSASFRSMLLVLAGPSVGSVAPSSDRVCESLRSSSERSCARRRASSLSSTFS